MTPIHAVRHAQDRAELLNERLFPIVQIPKILVGPLRKRFPMVPGHVRDQVDLPSVELRQVLLSDQTIRMLVVLRLGHRESDVMQDCSRLQDSARATIQSVQVLQLIEQRKGQIPHL